MPMLHPYESEISPKRLSRHIRGLLNAQPDFFRVRPIFDMDGPCPRWSRPVELHTIGGRVGPSHQPAR
jgi:hypothetical protein